MLVLDQLLDLHPGDILPLAEVDESVQHKFVLYLQSCQVYANLSDDLQGYLLVPAGGGEVEFVDFLAFQCGESLEFPLVVSLVALGFLELFGV